MEQQKKKDFFISYTAVDKNKAEWIAWQLEAAGYTTIIQAWDFGPGDNFVIEMQNAATEAVRTIAVLSPDYLQSKFTAPEWAAAFAQDPTGEKRLLIPVRVSEVDLTGLLRPIVYIDLVNCGVEEARKRLIRHVGASINGVRVKPDKEPPFWDDSGDTTIQPKEKIPHKQLNPSYKLGQIDREDHFEHLANHIPLEYCLRKGQTMGFVVHGPGQEWPESLRYKLVHLIWERTQAAKKTYPDDFLNQSQEVNLSQPEAFLWRLLGKELDIMETERKRILSKLQSAQVNYIFVRKMTPREVKQTSFLVELLVAWQAIKLKTSTPSHFLMLICETDYLEESEDNWRQRISTQLEARSLANALLPPISDSPNLDDHFSTWIDSHFKEDQHGSLIAKLKKKAAELKGENKRFKLPLRAFREHFQPVFNDYTQK